MARSMWVTPRARQDIVELASYIGRDSPDAADRLFDEFDRLCERIAEFPELGQLFPVSNPRLDGLRVLRVPRFLNHLVFYVPYQDGIQVVRVLHGARDLDAALQ